MLTSAQMDIRGGAGDSVARAQSKDQVRPWSWSCFVVCCPGTHALVLSSAAPGTHALVLSGYRRSCNLQGRLRAGGPCQGALRAPLPVAGPQDQPGPHSCLVWFFGLSHNNTWTLPPLISASLATFCLPSHALLSPAAGAQQRFARLQVVYRSAGHCRL